MLLNRRTKIIVQNTRIQMEMFVQLSYLKINVTQRTSAVVNFSSWTLLYCQCYVPGLYIMFKVRTATIEQLSVKQHMITRIKCTYIWYTALTLQKLTVNYRTVHLILASFPTASLIDFRPSFFNMSSNSRLIFPITGGPRYVNDV